MTAEKIPIIFCVDVEPDLRIIDRSTRVPWNGYQATHAYLPKLRERFEAVTGSPVHYTWFYRMDPQVEETYGSAAWAVEQYPEHVAEYFEKGDELALHTHAYRWDNDEQAWIVDHGNQPWINHSLKVSFQAFEAALRRPCETFRFGDRFMNTETMRELERLGVRYELTAEPGVKSIPALNLKEIHTGLLPDCRGMAYAPYRPSASDWRQPDPNKRDGIIVIPMSTGWGLIEQPSQSWQAKTTRLVKSLLGRPWKPWHPFETLNLGRPSSSIRLIFDHLLESLEKPYIACVIRTSTPYEPRKRAEFEATLAHITSHERVRDFVFATPQEALELLGFFEKKSG